LHLCNSKKIKYFTLIKIGISIGDLNGIGPEVVLKTFADNAMLNMCTPIIYASQKSLAWWRKHLQIEGLAFTTITSIDKTIAKQINIIEVWTEDIQIDPGKELPVTGKYAIKSFEAVCKDLQAKKIDAIVTAPISKKNVQSAEFPYHGHTDYLAKLFGNGDALMMMVSDDLRVGLATVHIPITDVSKNISTDGLQRKIEMLAKSLRTDFGIESPKIAVLGLNPHAGEGGTIGQEEKNIITPAIQKLKEKKLMVFGPYSSDGFFGNAQYKHFDAVLALYHDQGLIPFKTLAFDSGVNYSAGLSAVRTSPDHGTAFDIAGKNLADESSFRSAVFAAIDIVTHRNNYVEMTANPLKRNQMNIERAGGVA
jgi:4-hydroxythreonine-4-phosphate dehydrogenase